MRAEFIYGFYLYPIPMLNKKTLTLILACIFCISGIIAVSKKNQPHSSKQAVPAAQQDAPVQRQEVTLADLKNKKEHTSPLQQPNTYFFDTSGIVINLDNHNNRSWLEISLTSGAAYTIDYFSDNRFICTQSISPLGEDSPSTFFVHKLLIPEQASNTWYNRLVVKGADHGGPYAIGHIFLSDSALYSDDAPFHFDYSDIVDTIKKPQAFFSSILKDTAQLSLTVETNDTLENSGYMAKTINRTRGTFSSQRHSSTIWTHPFVLLSPGSAKSTRGNRNKPRKAVLIACPVWEGNVQLYAALYGERIVRETGYPVMICALPGQDQGGHDLEADLYDKVRLIREEDQNPYHSVNSQIALGYVRAIDALEILLASTMVRVITVGHSKRAGGSVLAAAVDKRIASVIMMSWERIPRKYENMDYAISGEYLYFQDQVKVPVFYIGVTNEDSYQMFNINKIQKQLKRPMTVSMIPNHFHSSFNEIQYTNVTMWVSHIFNKRPVVDITNVAFENNGNTTRYRAQISSSGSTIRMVRAWYAFCDHPRWSDVMWYHVVMEPRGNGLYEGSMPGSFPDAFYVEVDDISQGVPGYISSLPQPMKDTPVIPRQSRGPFPALWSPQ